MDQRQHIAGRGCNLTVNLVQRFGVIAEGARGAAGFGLDRHGNLGAIVAHAKDSQRQRLALARAVAAARHELVHVLEALVVAHVDDDAAVGGERDRRALVLEAAERRPLDRRRPRIPRVDLDDPSEAVGLVRMLRRVEALVELVPAVAEPLGGDAVSPLLRREAARRVDEVAVEVLLAREVGPPGSHAMGAVVDRAQHHVAGGVVARAQRRVTRRRARHADRRGAGDAPRVARRPHDRPAAAVDPRLDDRHAVRRLRLRDLLRGPGPHAVRVQEPVVGVLVVDDEQAVRRRHRGSLDHREVVERVVVHAGLLRLVGRRVRRVLAERRSVRHRVAPRVEHVGLVSLGHDDRIGLRRGDRDETRGRRLHRCADRAGRSSAPCERDAGERERAACERPLEQRAPLGVHLVEGRVAARVGDRVVVVHAGLAEAVSLAL